MDNPAPSRSQSCRISDSRPVLRIMTRVLEVCQSPSNPFEKLVRQEQLLHCNSIHAHLTNSIVNVNLEVKTTIKQLNLYLDNDVIRAKGRIINSDLPLDATSLQ